MSTQLSSLATRAASVATVTTALALAAVLPATPARTAALPGALPAAPTVAVAAPPPAVSAPRAPQATTRVEPAAVNAPLPAAVVATPAAVRASALSKAMSKIGSPYVWGATGPNSFDCSGLVSWAYKQVGVALPRTSRAQSGVGTPVSKADLQPGDLVFFYQPVSHVGIYVGDGKVVHASTSGQPVKISNVSAMPFASARRI